jgi:hypothetical protein
MTTHKLENFMLRTEEVSERECARKDRWSSFSSPCRAFEEFQSRCFMNIRLIEFHYELLLPLLPLSVCFAFQQ